MDTVDEPELARWNGRFEAEDDVFGTEPNGFLAAQRERFAAGRQALCIADGEGVHGSVVAAIFVQFATSDCAAACSRASSARCVRAGCSLLRESSRR